MKCIRESTRACVIIDYLVCVHADTSGTTTTSTTALHEGHSPTAASTTATPAAADRLRAAAVQGPKGGGGGGGGGVRGGRRPRRRNVPPSTNGATPAHGDSDAVEFPVTFRSADLFVVTKTKLYSTFSISLKVRRLFQSTKP